MFDNNILQLRKMNEHISADRLIGHHRARQDYVESPVNALQFGYGDHRYTKMTFELLNQSDVLKQKILKQAIEDFSLCDNVNLALLSSDLLSVVLLHLKNKNQSIRLLSATLFKKICAAPLGRKTIIQRDCILDYQRLIHDQLPAVKSQAYDGLIDFAEFIEGVEHILSKQSILIDLVDKLIEEKVSSILLKAIVLLKIIMQGEQGTPNALNTEIILRLMALIGHTSQSIQYNVCMTLANISFNEAGKASIIAKDCIKGICGYISHQDKKVREASCLLLCSLAQLNQGKIQILAHCPFDNIVKLLDDESATVLNAVQLIANLAEHPQGRELAQQIESKLEGLKSIQRKYIDETLSVIRWKP